MKFVILESAANRRTDVTKVKPLAQWLQSFWLVVGLVFLLGSLCWPSAIAWADDSADAPAPAVVEPVTELNATDIPSEKVDQFVSAYLSVAELIDDHTADLQRAETEAESLQLQRAVESEAFTLIQAAGLTRQDYFQLLGLANTDPEFRDRVLAQLEESAS
jgi:hypothetical protein